MKDYLNNLIDKVLDEKNFLFDKGEILDLYNKLGSECFDELNSTKILVKPTEQFTELFYNHLVRKYKFELTRDFDSTINFHSIVFADFKKNGNFYGLSEQMRALLGLLILKTNNQYEETFESFALSLNKETNNKYLYEFSSSFSDCLYKLNIPVDTLFKILRSLFLQLNAKVDYNVNISISQLLNGIRKFSKYNSKNAKEILVYSQENKTDDITSAILCGLYDNNSEDGLSLLQEQLKYENNRIVPLVVANLVPKNKRELNSLFRLFENSKSNSDSYSIYLVRAYINLIKHSPKGNLQLVRDCFERIFKLASVDNSRVQQNILVELRYLKGYDKQKYHVIEIVNNKELDPELLSNIGALLNNFSETEHFFKFLRKYATSNKLRFEAENFSLQIDHFRNSDAKGFSEQLIYLLIDDLGEIRFVGHRILSHLNILGTYRPGFDITALTALDQTKFWVSILHGSMEPKYSLPLILPLRKSKSSLVVEALEYKIAEMVENYTSTVSNELEKFLDLNDDNDKKFFKSIESKFNEFKRMCNDKSDIKELNPHHTQSRLFRIFNENFSERISGNMDKSVRRKSSILDFVSTVKLTKGGGWKAGSDRPVSQLSEISASFQFPRWYYLAPEKYDYEMRISFIENWKEQFKEWEAIIYSSEST